MSASRPAIEPPPPPGRRAWLLDMDGTLLDIAPTPDSVVVPPDLPDVLRRLRDQAGGALAIVTGRPVAQVEALLGDAPHAIAGEHGVAIRHSPGAVVERLDLPSVPQDWRDAAAELVARHPGTLLEPKHHGFVVHFRARPELGEALWEQLNTLIAPGATAFRILAAKMAWEIKPAGADKGTAVRALLSRPPFAGQTPIFIGDDVTDEDGMAAARAAGGLGLMVPDVFGDAAGVRSWLAARAAD